MGGIFDKPKSEEEGEKEKPTEKEKQTEENSQKDTKKTDLNKKERKQITEEDIKKYYTMHRIFPSFIKLNCGIFTEFINEGLKEIEYENITKDIINKYEQKEIENINNMDIDKDKKIELQIIYLKNNFEINQSKSYGLKEKYYYGIYKLCSFQIKEKDLSLTEEYENQISEIANTQLNDLEKTDKLFELFKEKGYLISKTVYIGGIFMQKENESTLERSNTLKANGTFAFKNSENSNYNLSCNKRNYSFSKINNLNILGGDLSADDIQTWKSSVNLDNSQIIDCKDIIPITKILKDELKTKLAEQIKVIENHFKLIEEYYKIINKVRGIDLEGNHYIGTFSSFDNLEDLGESILNSSLIDCKVYEFNDKAKIFGTICRNITKTFNDIIIGIKIIDIKPSWLSNGEWTINGETILSKKLNIFFESKVWRTQNYFIIIYILKYPEIKFVQEETKKFDLTVEEKVYGNLKEGEIEKKIEKLYKTNDEVKTENFVRGQMCSKVKYDDNIKLNPNVEIGEKAKENKNVLKIQKNKLAKVGTNI